MFNNKMMAIVGVLIDLARLIKKHLEDGNLTYKFDDTEEKKEINAIIG